MPYREFDDGQGRRWRVWDTYPQSFTTSSAQLPGFGAGWLTFEALGSDTATEKRRLAPVPAEWAQVDEPGLREMLGGAETCERAGRAPDPAAEPAPAG